jgi:hypothetical protein
MSRTNKSNHLFVAALVASATTMVASGCGDLEPHGVPVPAKDSPARACATRRCVKGRFGIHVGLRSLCADTTPPQTPRGTVKGSFYA